MTCLGDSVALVALNAAPEEHLVVQEVAELRAAEDLPAEPVGVLVAWRGQVDDQELQVLLGRLQGLRRTHSLS